MAGTKRVIVVAPTRATCMNLKVLLETNEFPTRLMEERGLEIMNLAKSEEGFGIIAVTGAGKSASIKPIVRQKLEDALRVDIVTRENEVTDYTWQCNVVVVTPGIAMIWAKNNILKPDDMVIFDEIHQTSDHLELAEALSLYIGCKVIWMSATVDPEIFAKYLKSSTVIKFDKVDETKKAKVEIIDSRREGTFLAEMIKRVNAEKRGLIVFLPTRQATEDWAKKAREVSPDATLKVEFYHGGESASKLLPYLNRGNNSKNRPFVIFMTNAGQSSLNIEGLNTVVIKDECIRDELHSGVAVRVKTRLPTNDILQMGGRVNGRVSDGEIFILSDRNIDFHSLKPTKVEFVLGHNLERLALTCGKIGIDLAELELPEPVDKEKYVQVVKKFVQRGIFEPDGINLTPYGKRIERIPTSAAWAEMIVNSPDELLDLVAICASSPGLHRILRQENNVSEFVVSGSDHLTLYNVVAYAIAKFGGVNNRNGSAEYYFRKDFYDWAREKGVNAKEIKEIALALKSVLHSIKEKWLQVDLPQADEKAKNQFVDLLAKVGSLDIVSGESDISGNTIWTAKTSRCKGSEIIFGSVDVWQDKRGHTRRTIEGTNVPDGIVNKYSKKEVKQVSVCDDGDKIKIVYGRKFAGMKIDDSEEIVEQVSVEIVPQAVKAFAEYLSQGYGKLPCVMANRKKRDEIEILRIRSAGQVQKVSSDQLRDFYISKLGTSYTKKMVEDANLDLTLTDNDVGHLLGINYSEVRAKVLAENPDSVSVAGKEYPVRYERDRNDKFKAVVEIEPEAVFGLKAEDVPNLPSGRVLTLKSAGYEKEDLNALKSEIEEARLQKSWDEFRKTALVGVGESEDLKEIIFDADRITGTSAVGYAVREVSYYSSGSYDLSRIETHFTRDKKQAEEIAELTRKIRQLAEIAAELPKIKSEFEEMLKNVSDNKELVEEEIRQARNLLETASESVFYSGSYIRKDCDPEILKKQIAEIGQRLPQVSELAVKRREVKSKAKETFDKASEQVSKIRDLAYEESSHITQTDKESVNLAFEPLENAWRNGKYEEIEALSQKVNELVAKINERVACEEASVKILHKHLSENYSICPVCGQESQIPTPDQLWMENEIILCHNNHSSFLVGMKVRDVVKTSRFKTGGQVVSLEVGKEKDYEERDYEDEDGIREEWVPAHNPQLVIKVNHNLLLDESSELIVDTPWITPTKEEVELVKLRQELANLQAQKTESEKEEAENSANSITVSEYARQTFQKAQELKLFIKPDQNDWGKTAEWKEKRKQAAQEGSRVFVLTFQKEGEELSSKVGFGEKLEAKIFIQPYPAVDPEEGKNFYCQGNQVLFVHRGGLGILVNIVGLVNASQEIDKEISKVQARIAELETAKGSEKKKEEGKTSSAATNLVAEMNKMWNK